MPLFIYIKNLYTTANSIRMDNENHMCAVTNTLAHFALLKLGSERMLAVRSLIVLCDTAIH